MNGKVKKRRSEENNTYVKGKDEEERERIWVKE